jgi:hypothetical protein
MTTNQRESSIRTMRIAGLSGSPTAMAGPMLEDKGREFETCYIRRYEENTGPHHQKICSKDRRRGGKARAKSKSLRVGIGLFLNSRLGRTSSRRSDGDGGFRWYPLIGGL